MGVGEPLAKQEDRPLTLLAQMGNLGKGPSYLDADVMWLGSQQFMSLEPGGCRFPGVPCPYDWEKDNVAARWP